MGIKDKQGRTSIDPFADDSLEGDQSGLDSGSDQNRLQKAASSAFPNPEERRKPGLTPAELNDYLAGQAAADADADAEAGAAAVIPEFKFLECDPLLPGEDPDPCAVCRPNEYAYVPDYTLMKGGETFFDGKRCFQSIIIAVPSPAKPKGPQESDLKDPAFQKEKKEEGIRLMLDYFNKSDVATVYYYVRKPPGKDVTDKLGSGLGLMAIIGGATVGAVLGARTSALAAAGATIGGAAAGGAAAVGLQALIPEPIPGYELIADERDVVEELMRYTEYEYHIPIQKKGRTRILISFSVEYLNRIPSRAITEPDTEFETNLECTIQAEDFYPMFRRSIHALNFYGRQLARWTTIDGGSLVNVGSGNRELLDLNEEANKLIDFRDNVNAFVKDHGFSFRGFNQIEKISFKFEQPKKNKLELRQVIFNKPGCDNIIISKNGRFKGLFNDLVKLSPFGRSRTLYYVGALPEMDLALQAREAMPWLEFVTTFTFPRLEVSYGGSSDTLANDPSMAGCLGDSTFSDSTVDDFMNTLSGLALGLPDAILQGMAKDTCKTREEAQEELDALGEGDKAFRRSGKPQKTGPFWNRKEDPEAEKRKTLSDVAANTGHRTGAISKEQYGDFKDELKKQKDRVLAEYKRKVATDDPQLAKILEEIEREVGMKAFRSQESAAKQKGNQLNRAQRRGAAVKPGGTVITGGADYEYKKGDRGSRRESYRESAKDAEQLLWQRINNRLGWCGWLALTMKAVDCVAQGMGEDSALGALTEAAFKSMSDAHLERVFLGLPPEEQQKIFNTLADDLKGLPAPWEVEFRTGSYSGPGFSQKEKKETRQEDKRRENAIAAYVELTGRSGIDIDYSDWYKDYSTEEIENLLVDSGEAAIEELLEAAEDYSPPEDVEDYLPEGFEGWDPHLAPGDDIEALEQTMLYLGYDIEPGREYNAETEEVIRKFQRDHGLPETGFATEELLKQLSEAVEQRTQDIRDALAASEPPPPPRQEGPGYGGVPGGQDPGLFGVGYDGDTFSFGGAGSDNPGSGGTYGQALAGFNKVLVDAYRNAMLQAVGADVLLNELNKLPGAPIVAAYIKHLPCKPTPPFAMDPRIDNFLSTLEFGLDMETCKFDHDITLPERVMPDEGNFNVFTWIYENVLEAIKNLLLAAMMAALKLILQKIGQFACDAIATLGASLLDLYDGSDHFRDLLKDNMCPDATDDDLYNALQGIFSTLGPDASCLETLTNSEMADFIDDLSVMLTQGQILELLQGNPSEQTLQLAIEVALTSDSECIREIFSDPNAFLTYFPALGIFIPNMDELAAELLPGDLDYPVSPCPPAVIEKIDELRCDLLAQKGLSTEECRNQIDNIKDQAVQDLKDLSNLLNNGPFSDFPPIVGDPASECPSNGFYNPIDPVMLDMAGQVSSLLFMPIEERHIKDLMGPINPFTGTGGMINAIMSDTEGRPWKKHNWMVRFFGSPNASDLGFFEWASDNAIKDPESGIFQPAPIDIYGSKLTKNEGKGNSWFGASTGGFPPTVGAWMSKALLDLEPEFKTVITPGGYPSVQAAINDVEKTHNTNDVRISRRRKYVKAFIKAYDLEDRSGGKRSQAAADLMVALDRKIFLKGDPDKRPGWVSKNSPEDLLREVLLGKQILGGVGKKGKGPGHGGGTGQTPFVEYYEKGEKYRLLELPDTSSADVRLKYEGYPDDPDDAGAKASYEFSLEYDYNLFDKEGILEQDNKYRLKVVETHRSPSGGGKKLRKQLKKEGSEAIPPASILDEGEYIYTIYDVESQNAPTGDVQEFIDGLELDDAANIPDSFQVESLFRYFAQIFLENTEDANEVNNLIDSGKLRQHFAQGSGKGRNNVSSNFDAINNGFLRRVANLISTGKIDMNPNEKDDGGESDPGFLEPPELEDQNKSEQKTREQIGLEYISPGFLFGYDPFKEPEIIYLDNETYGGPLGRLFPDKIPPPFYVQEQRYTGWMDIAQALVPEVDGCEPARRHLLDLTPLASQSSELGSKLLNDHRLEYDPLCVQEAPFDRILTNFDAGNIDGAIRAIIRIYVLDMYLRAVPVFIQFGLTEQNFDDLLQAFAAERIKQGLYQDGVARTGRTDDEYYCRFLEQCVNVVVRKVDSGILKIEEPTETTNGLLDGSMEEYDALNKIVKAVDKFYRQNEGELAVLSDAAIKGQSLFRRAISTPATSQLASLGYGSSRFNKTAAKKAKARAFEDTILEYEPEATVFLKKYIREEFEAIKEDFSQRIPASVNDINHLFLLNDLWIRGGVYGNGPFNVMSDPAISSNYIITEGQLPNGLSGTQQTLKKHGLGPMAEMLGSSFEDMAGDWPFVLEKYIRIEDKTKAPRKVRKRKSNLYDIVNIEDWDAYVKEKKAEGLTGDISDFWGNPLLIGETDKIEDHTHTYEIDDTGDGRSSIHADAYGNEHYHEIKNGVLERAEMDPEDDGHTHEIPIIGWKFGLRICYLPSKDDKNISAFRGLVNTISGETVMNKKAFNLASPTGARYLIPIASAELPIPDQDFTLFNPDSYDVYCLIDELVKTVEYKFLFKYIFPLPRFTSILAIYNIMGFYDSIGNVGYPSDGGDLWEKPGGRQGKKFRVWIRGPNAFKKSRQVARDVFSTIYNAAQAIDFNNENRYGHPDRATSIRDALRPRVNFEDGLRWWQRGRRIFTRPYNMAGEECED